MRRTHLWSSLVFAGGCSTLAPLPTPQECERDDDCAVDQGEVCAPDTRVCVPQGDLPPRADLGFDIQELVEGQVVFRTEVGGCDVALTGRQSLPPLRGRDFEQTFELTAFARPPADVTAPVVEDLVAGAIELSQPSRFARAPLFPPRIDYPTLDASGEMVTVLPTVVKWPRYDPADLMPPVLEDGGFVLWRTLPTDNPPMLQMIVPPVGVAPSDPDDPGLTTCTSDLQCCDVAASGDECEAGDPNRCLTDLGLCTAIGNPRFAFSYQYQDRCAREIKDAEVVIIDGETLEDAPSQAALVGVPITVRHADSPGGDRLGVHAIDPIAPGDREAQCDGDDECIAGEQFCDLTTNQCVLALAGRPADGGGIQVDDTGRFTAFVYTYCNTDPIENPPEFRSFTFSVAPEGPLSALSYTTEIEFRPFQDDTKPTARISKRLCIPDWGASVPLSLQLVGEAVPLLGTGDDAFICCDVGCLPASEENATNFEPTKQTTCDGSTVPGSLKAFVSADLKLDAAQRLAWDAVDCLSPDPTSAGGGVVGGIRREMDCSGLGDATCVAPDLAAGKDGSPRDYELRLESPIGSLFTSRRITVPVEASGAPQKVTLERRVLVRGRVRLDEVACAEAAPVDGDCGSEGALVRAERLRMPGESVSAVVGPYFHEVPTYYDPITERSGDYVLPLDPGVYLLTALPLSGSRGGPAAIELLDLRDGEDVERDLVLGSGVLVTLDLSGFDPRAQIVPLDRGSWRDLIHPGRADDPDPVARTVDLNAIGECLQSSDEIPQGCRIRRLISGQTLTASQVGQVRFTARADADAGKCPG
jgi:hypothetical protein